jgi:hypothetical protein
MIAAMMDPEAYSSLERRRVLRKVLKSAVSLVALAISLASLFAASWVGLALIGY